MEGVNEVCIGRRHLAFTRTAFVTISCANADQLQYDLTSARNCCYMNARRLAGERNELVLATKHVAPGVIITPDNLPRIQGGPQNVATDS